MAETLPLEESANVTATKVALALNQVDNTADADKPISTAQAAVNAAQVTTNAGKVPVAGIVTSAPEFRITGLTISGITGVAAANGNGSIQEAGAAEFPNTDGRIGFTDSGDLEGAVFLRGVYYNAAFGKWRCLVSVSGTNYEWDYPSSAMTIEGILGLTPVALAGAEALGLPLLTVTAVEVDASFAGQHFVQSLDGGISKLWMRKPGSLNGFIPVGSWDSDGNNLAKGLILRSVTLEEAATDRPKLDEKVRIAGTDLICVGDGINVVNGLPWIGNHTITIDVAYATANKVGSTLRVFSNAQHVTIHVTDDINAAGVNVLWLDVLANLARAATLVVTAAQTSGVTFFSAGGAEFIDPSGVHYDEIAFLADQSYVHFRYIPEIAGHRMIYAKDIPYEEA